MIFHANINQNKTAVTVFLSEKSKLESKKKKKYYQRQNKAFYKDKKGQFTMKT